MTATPGRRVDRAAPAIRKAWRIAKAMTTAPGGRISSPRLGEVSRIPKHPPRRVMDKYTSLDGPGISTPSAGPCRGAGHLRALVRGLVPPPADHHPGAFVASRLSASLIGHLRFCWRSSSVPCCGKPSACCVASLPERAGGRHPIIGFFVLIAGLFALIIPPAVDQSRELASQANAGIRTIQRWLQGPPVNLQESQFNDALTQATSWLQNQSGRIASEVAAGASATLSALMTLFIVGADLLLPQAAKFLPWSAHHRSPSVGFRRALTRC